VGQHVFDVALVQWLKDNVNILVDGTTTEVQKVIEFFFFEGRSFAIWQAHF